MEKKKKPAGEVSKPTGNNDKTAAETAVQSISYRLPFGQAVPFVAYEKVAGGAKGLVHLGQEVCPKFDKSNYSKAKKPDETGVTLYRPIIKAWKGAYPEIAAKQPRRHEAADRPNKDNHKSVRRSIHAVATSPEGAHDAEHNHGNAYGLSDEPRAKAAPTIDHVWRAYGLGWFTDKVDDDRDGEVILRCYYGSSSYDRKQMAALIDYVVQDCKAVDIETLTPAELAGLVDRWEVDNGKVQRRAQHNAG